MARLPLISVITPVYNPGAEVLQACIDSVRNQTYGRWELCLVDDASPDGHVWPILERAMVDGPRIRLIRREVNGGIIAASNDAARMATGDVITLLDHDDLLTPDALQRVAETFAADPEVDYVYSDEDVLDMEGRLIEPFFKPDWSPERFRTQMYTCHLSSIRRRLFDEVGGFRPGFDGSQDWDLILRVTERARKVVHIPEVLYHWRIVPTSVLAGEHVKPYAYEAGLRALAEHCERIGLDGAPEELDTGYRGYYRVRRRISDRPLVSIVIPTRGTSGRVWGVERVMVVEAVRSVVGASTWDNLEIVVVADVETPPDVIDELRAIAGDRLRLVWWEHPFNFSAKCNLGAAHARGDVLVFLNDDTEVITPDWIETLYGFAREDDVGAVGCVLLFEDGRLQHGGHVLLGGNPGHLMFGQSPTSPANRMALSIDREVSGVTAAAMMMRRDVFDAVGGFCPAFPGNFNDVDLCAKVRAAGHRIVVTPHARLYHFESVSRDPSIDPAETALLRSRWWDDLHRDPYYNPNFTPGLDNYPMPTYYP